MRVETRHKRYFSGQVINQINFDVEFYEISTDFRKKPLFQLHLRKKTATLAGVFKVFFSYKLEKDYLNNKIN